MSSLEETYSLFARTLTTSGRRCSCTSRGSTDRLPRTEHKTHRGTLRCGIRRETTIPVFRNRLQHTGIFADVVIMTGGNTPVSRLEDSPQSYAEQRGRKSPYDRPDPSGQQGHSSETGDTKARINGVQKGTELHHVMESGQSRFAQGQSALSRYSTRMVLEAG